MRRLQLELPLLLAPAANVTSAANDGATPPPVPPADKPKRGPKKRHKHGRPKLPAHLTRVPEVLRDTLAKILAGEKDLTALLPETYAAARAEAARAKAA